MRLFARHPAAAIDILTVMGSRLRQTDLMLALRASRNANEVLEEKATFGERVADGVARFGGSWYFIFSFAAILVVVGGAEHVSCCSAARSRSTPTRSSSSTCSCRCSPRSRRR